MWVGQVACSINLVGLYFAQQLADNLYVALGHGQLLYLPAFIEGKVEKMNLCMGNLVVGACSACLSATDELFHGADIQRVDIALFFLLEKVFYLAVFAFDVLVGILAKQLIETVHKVHVAGYLLIVDGNVARCLIGNVYTVPLLYQSADGATHRDDVVVGMG